MRRNLTMDKKLKVGMLITVTSGAGGQFDSKIEKICNQGTMIYVKGSYIGWQLGQIKRRKRGK